MKTTRITQGATVRLNIDNLFELRNKFFNGDNIYDKFLKKLPKQNFDKDLTFLTYEQPYFDKATNTHHETCRVRGLLIPVHDNRTIDISELLIPAESIKLIQQQYQHT